MVSYPTAPTKRFVVIDDNPADIALLRHYLTDIPDLSAELLSFTQPEAGIQAASSPGVDLVFLDYFLGAQTGLELFQSRIKGACRAPVIMLTGQGDELIAVEAMKAGVTDYLIKESLETGILRRTISYALEKAALNEFKNELLGIAAHDLRSPIGLIKGYAAFLHSDLADSLDERHLHYLEKIRASTELMVRLIDDILDLSRIEAGKLVLNKEWIDLAEVIATQVALMQPLARKKDLVIELFADEGLPRLELDPQKIEQVVMNLLSNAIKFSYPGREIRVEVIERGDRIRVEIIDQGQGIPADEQSRLFQPFSKTTVKPTGGEKSTGLGLAICQRIIGGHGGEMGLTSELGKGSTFHFSFGLPDEE